MMIRYLLAAIVAGLIAGAAMTAAQEIKVVPLILHAEEYETGGHEAEHGAVRSLPGRARIAELLNPVGTAHAHGDAEGNGTLFGLDRFGGTLLANLVVGAGFGLVLMAAALICGMPLTVRTGVLWGAAGWLTFQFLPAMGLPPELPGFPAAELGERQIWWGATVFLSAVGLYLLIALPQAWAKAAGIIVLALPHLYGAPQPSSIESAVPALLAAEYAVAALATTAFFWVVLGLLMGAAMDRLEEPG